MRKQKINWLQYLYWNRSLELLVNFNYGILPYVGCKWDICNSAKIQSGNGCLSLGIKKNKKSKRETLIYMEKNSCLQVSGAFDIYAGTDIQIFKNAKLELGSGYFNSGVQVRCSKKIIIGQDVVIGPDVIIRDSDGHKLGDDRYKGNSGVKIDNHVWIGARAMIMKGVTIGEGAVIAAGAVVTHTIPPFCIAAGVPAKIIRKRVNWR